MNYLAESISDSATLAAMSIQKFLFLLILLKAGFSLISSVKKPKIVFRNRSYNFGKVLQGSMLECSFEFINDGDSTLIIKKIHSPAFCTGFITDGESEFSEGESGEIKVTFNTKDNNGHVEKQICIFSNDTESPDNVLTFTCEIETKTN